MALVPNVPVDVVLAWDDHPTAELNSLMVTTRVQRRQQQQLHDKKGKEAEAAPNGLAQLVEDPEVEKEGVDSPCLTRGPVSEYPKQQDEGNGSVMVNDLHPSQTPSEAHTHTFMQERSYRLLLSN